MSVKALRDVGLWLDKYALAGDANEGSLNLSVDKVDATTFGQTYRVFKPGLFTLAYSVTGLVNVGNGVNEEYLTNFCSNNTGIPTTIAPDESLEGNKAIFFLATQSTKNFDGTIGEMFKFTVNGSSYSGRPVNGVLLEPGATSRNANGTTTGVLYKAAGASDHLNAILHVLTMNGTGGPTLTINVQSAAAANFVGAANRVTFAAQNNTCSVVATPVDGPITDTYWRVKYDMSGTGPAFKFVVGFGIQ